MQRTRSRPTLYLTSVLIGALGLISCESRDSATATQDNTGITQSESATAQQAAAVADTCDDALGEWQWFTGGLVHIRPDGVIVHEPGNDGTWECTDAARGLLTLRWRVGGYVNTLMLSLDGEHLSSADPAQPFVSATRAPRPDAQPADRSQEVAQLLQRINTSFRDAVYAEHPDTANAVSKGIAIAVEKDSMLLVRRLTCEATVDAGVAMAVYLCEEDKTQGGRGWVDDTLRISIATFLPETVQVMSPNEHDGDSHRAVLFQNRGEPGIVDSATRVGCKTQPACEAMAADLKSLMSALGEEL